MKLSIRIRTAFAAAIALVLCSLSLVPNQVHADPQRGRPYLNSARTTFVGDNGQPLRGPYISTEWTSAAPYDQIARIKNLGFNAVHHYAECFDINYPNAGSKSPGYAATEIDKVVERTRELGLYLVMTIGNGANNGNHNTRYAKDFWSFYSSRYANETHVLYEIHNEPVAWGPPYSSTTATPTGAVEMNVDVYKTIRANAPKTPVLIFSYSVFGGTGGTTEALKDIQAFNSAVFGKQDAVWTNEAVAFHGYAGWEATSTAVDGLLKAGYPCFMTEYAGGAWGSGTGGFDIQLTSELERMGVSWLTFQYIPPSGVSDDVTKPEYFSALVENAGLSWKPDYGNWPAARGVHGNGGLPRKTSTWVNNFLTGTTRIEAEDFDWGGNDVSFYDKDSENKGAQYRLDEAVDIETTKDADGGYNVGWIEDGEWLEYTIWVQHPGYYNLALRVANNSGGSVQVNFGNQDKTGTWVLPVTGGVQTWKTDTRQVFLGSGRQKLRINALSGGFNLNWIELSPVSTGPIADGTYKFLNRANTMTLQEVTSNNSIVTSTYKGTADQHWKIQHIGGGQYRISSAGRGWNWNWWMGFGTVGWWGTGSGTCFIIRPTGDGYYRFVLVNDGTNLEISNNDSSKIEGKAYHEGANQQWAIQLPSAPVFPTGLSATLNSSGNAVNLKWNTTTGANSYNVKRSTTSTGPYTKIATGITSTNYTDDSVVAGAKYYYVVSAVSNEVETLNSAEATLLYPKLTGTVIGTTGSWNNSGNTIAKIFDNDLNSYFDAAAGSGCWAGLDFGVGVSNVVMQISYCPRPNFSQRMVGGIFQGANLADFSDAVTLFTITAQPATGVLTSANVTNTNTFRYVRYLSPDGSYGNVAEIQFLGAPKSAVTPTPTPTLIGIKGDLNDDGKINSMDFALFRLHLLGVTPLTGKNLSNSDVSGDGNANSIDFALMKQYLLGMISSFPGQTESTPTPTSPTPTPAATAKFHCFLLLGQSNMAGYALAQTSDKVEDPRVLVLGYDNNPALGRVKDQWDVACPPLHPSWLDAIGPGDWFGKTMIQKVPSGDTIGLIPCAISGEKIETFMKSGGSKYSWITDRAKLAQQKGGVIEGIIFHQGESNNGDPAWPGKVKTLVDDLRKDLNIENAPFIAGELLYSGPCAGHNKLVNQLPSLINNCYVVSASDLVVDPSDTTYRLHFSHDSSVTLGKRYAEKMIQVLGW